MVIRYGILKCMADMCRTLEKAAVHFSEQPDSGMREELVENGARMLQQLQQVLSQQIPPDTDEAKLLRQLQQDWQAQAFGTELIGRLQAFRCGLPKAVPHQVRVVLYAELGQKWDSLASVYDWMKKDSRFDVVVVLTPVFRLDPQGKTPPVVIYEDYLTGLGIPFYGYQDYSLEEDQPDLAIICQPYSGATLPQFTPQYISQRTRLVYAMYCLPWVVQKNLTTGLVGLPCYELSWRVVGNSPQHYAYYSRYNKTGGANMRVTGLPKTDAMVTLKKEGTAFPAEWEKLRGKKIFLWNTWYDARKSSVCFLAEMLKFFEQHPEYGLIWRPHPITPAVNQIFQSPKFCKAYFNNMKYAQQMQNAVVDEFDSSEAAFFYSDALISDISSLIPQYLILDKPVLMVENKDIELDETAGIMRDDWVEKARTAEGIFDFIERIARGEDEKKELRKKAVQEDMPLADGHAAERLCQVLYEDMLQEDFN